MSAPTTSRATRITGVVAAVIGVALSTYLTVEHYGHSATLACPESATINCLKVTTSKWSTVAGVPVAVAGLAYFVVMTALSLVPADTGRIAAARFGGAVVGILTVLYLVYVEIFDVNAICLWCTAVHVCTLVLFAASLARFIGPSVRDGRR